MLEGPESIEVTDEQLEQLKKTYENLSDEFQELLRDFFIPLNMMRDVGVFTGKSADKFVDFCDIVQYYLDLQIQIASEKYQQASATFAGDIHEAESII